VTLWTGAVSVCFGGCLEELVEERQPTTSLMLVWPRLDVL